MRISFKKLNNSGRKCIGILKNRDLILTKSNKILITEPLELFYGILYCVIKDIKKILNIFNKQL